MFEYRIWCETEATHVTVWADTAPTECPNSAGHTIDPVKTVITQSGEVSLTQRVVKVEKVNRLAMKFSALSIYSYLDDFSDDSGIDVAESFGYALSPEGFVTVADGETSAEVVTLLLETQQTKREISATMVVFEGSPTFYASDDDGSSWTEITSDVALSLNGKKWRLKAVLTPGDQLAAWGFDVS